MYIVLNINVQLPITIGKWSNLKIYVTFIFSTIICRLQKGIVLPNMWDKSMIRERDRYFE